MANALTSITVLRYPISILTVVFTF